jgi:hypothetical protein
MANAKDNDAFCRELFFSRPLDAAIEWITQHMRPEEVYDEDALAKWAEENDYEKADK